MSTTEETTGTGGRRLSGGARRKQLLRVGLDLFSSTPYDLVSVDDIARATGTARGLLYHYFGSKRGFYVEVLEASAQELVDVLRPDPDTTPDPVARLTIKLRDGLDWIVDHQAGYRTVLWGGIGTDPEVQAVVERVRDAIADLVLASVVVEEHARPLAEAHVRGWVGYLEGLLPRMFDGELTTDHVIGLGTVTLLSWFGATDGVELTAEVG